MTPLAEQKQKCKWGNPSSLAEYLIFLMVNSASDMYYIAAFGKQGQIASNWAIPFWLTCLERQQSIHTKGNSVIKINFPSLIGLIRTMHIKKNLDAQGKFPQGHCGIWIMTLKASANIHSPNTKPTEVLLIIGKWTSLLQLLNKDNVQSLGQTVWRRCSLPASMWRAVESMEIVVEADQFCDGMIIKAHIHQATKLCTTGMNPPLTTAMAEWRTNMMHTISRRQTGVETSDEVHWRDCFNLRLHLTCLSFERYNQMAIGQIDHHFIRIFDI